MGEPKDASEQLMQEYIKATRDQKRAKQQEAVAGVFKKAGNLWPRGIKHPDSLVKKPELYGPAKGSAKMQVPGQINLRKGLRANSGFDMSRLRGMTDPRKRQQGRRLL